MTKRDVSLDVAKALGIFMVVFLHVRLYGPARSVGGIELWLDNFCGIASMSVFFMMSGCFSEKLFERGDVRQLLARMFGCLWPVLTVFGIAVPLVQLALFGGEFQLAAFARRFVSAGWFFECLALGTAVTFAAYRLARGSRMLLGFILAAVYLAIWALPVGLFHAVEMLPFFWFGLFALRRIRESRFRAAIGLSALGVYLIACVACGDFVKCGLIFHFSQMQLAAFSWTGLGLMAARIALGVMGALGFLELVRFGVDGIPALGRLAAVGTETMGIFFLHVLIFVLYFNLCRLGWYGGGLPFRAIQAVAALGVSYGAVLLINWNRWVRALVWNPLILFRPDSKAKGASA